MSDNKSELSGDRQSQIPSREDVIAQSSFFIGAATADFRTIQPYSNTEKDNVWNTLRLPDPSQSLFTFNYLQLHVALSHLRETSQPATFITTQLDHDTNQINCYQWNISRIGPGIKIEGSDASDRFRDALTGNSNRAFHDLVKKTYGDVPGSFGSIIIGDINDLKTTNDTQGHSAGDNLIQNTFNLFYKVMRPDDLVFRSVSRTGGDESATFLPFTDFSEAKKMVDRLNQEILDYNKSNPQNPISVSFGIATWNNNIGINIDEAEELADKRMYQDKAKTKDKAKEEKENYKKFIKGIGDISQFS